MYQIPPRSQGRTPVEKRIPESVFKSAATELRARGRLTRQWFRETFPDLATHDPCTFTTLGGMFELLGEVEYAPSVGTPNPASRRRLKAGQLRLQDE